MRNETHTFETTILEVIPVTINFSMAPSDRSVGIDSSYVDEWYITEINGEEVDFVPDWMERLMSELGADELIVEMCHEYLE